MIRALIIIAIIVTNAIIIYFIAVKSKESIQILRMGDSESSVFIVVFSH